MAARKLKLEKTPADSLVEFCESTLILPDDLMRVATNQKPKEPFLLDARQLGGRSETERMLNILHFLWKSDSTSFDRAANGIKGNTRLWFSKDQKAISETGNSNHSRRIGNSPWYVSS